jgi:hypothetical protein
MQQYLFTSPNPDRDSSVDGDVVFHEFGHGISNRLIGNGTTALSGIQSGAMGEGWSDYWAITINNDGAVGEYVTNNPNGIRRAAYSVPAATVHDSYADVCFRGCAVHADGEVWAATLWDLWNEVHTGATIVSRCSRWHSAGRSKPEWRSELLRHLGCFRTPRHGRFGCGQ